MPALFCSLNLIVLCCDDILLLPLNIFFDTIYSGVFFFVPQSSVTLRLFHSLPFEYSIQGHFGWWIVFTNYPYDILCYPKRE